MTSLDWSNWTLSHRGMGECKNLVVKKLKRNTLRYQGEERLSIHLLGSKNVHIQMSLELEGTQSVIREGIMYTLIQSNPINTRSLLYNQFCTPHFVHVPHLQPPSIKVLKYTTPFVKPPFYSPSLQLPNYTTPFFTTLKFTKKKKNPTKSLQLIKYTPANFAYW